MIWTYQIKKGEEMQRNRWIQWLLVAVVTVMMGACGGGSDVVSRVEKAIIAFYDQDHGLEPWVTDGEVNGTKLLKDANEGGGHSIISNVVTMGENYYFVTTDQEEGLDSPPNPIGKLWKSDGTPEGTVLVKDMTDLGLYSPFLINFKEELYLFADHGLWKINSAEGDLNRIAEFSRGDEWYRYNVVVSGDKLYFSASDISIWDDTGKGLELWVSDGTSDGTKVIKDIREGEEASNPFNLTDVGGTLYFTANDDIRGRDLWRSDGTPEGTRIVRGEGASALDAEDLVAVGNTLYFCAYDSTKGKEELWKSDGTAENTQIVKDTAGNMGSDLRNTVVHKGKLYFTVNDSVHELWVSDGTATGTKKIKDLNQYLNRLTSVTDTLVFTTSDGEGIYVLWTSDGTEAGTKIIKNFTGYTSLGNSIVGGSLLLYSNTDDSLQLWKTDGTEEGTSMLKKIVFGHE
jgi:ELWxxDGT repeat protein